MNNYNVDNFKTGACIVSFNGTVLGATRDGVTITLKADTYDVKRDSNSSLPVRRIVTGMQLTITTELLEIDSGMSLMLDSNGNLEESLVGTDLLDNVGILLLTPVNDNDTTGYQFPAAVLEPNFKYTYDAKKNHAVSVTFTAEPDSSGVLMSKVSA